MITLFNRKELLITYDRQRHNDACTVLDSNKIPYKVATKDLASPSPFGSSRARIGSFGIDLSSSCEYKIYVNKDDHERAAYLLKTNL